MLNTFKYFKKIISRKYHFLFAYSNVVLGLEFWNTVAFCC